MSIENRTLGANSGKHTFNWSTSGVFTNSATLPMIIFPFPCEVETVKVYTELTDTGSAPSVRLGKGTYSTAGTSISVFGDSLALVAYTSGGIQGISLPATGSTSVGMGTGDILYLINYTTGSKAYSLTVSVVVKKLQDIVTHYGL